MLAQFQNANTGVLQNYTFYVPYWDPEALQILWFNLFLVFIQVKKIIFVLFLGMAIYDYEFETKENKVQTKEKIEPQHILLVTY